MSSANPPPNHNSLQTALAQLGIEINRATIIRFVVSVLAGYITSVVLPFIYPFVMPPFLDFVFGRGGAGTPRDYFNTISVTLLTFAASFLVSLVMKQLQKVSA